MYAILDFVTERQIKAACVTPCPPNPVSVTPPLQSAASLYLMLPQSGPKFGMFYVRKIALGLWGDVYGLILITLGFLRKQA